MFTIDWERLKLTLAIDPGLSGVGSTGWALFQGPRLKDCGLVSSQGYGKPPDSWEERCVRITRNMYTLMKDLSYRVPIQKTTTYPPTIDLAVIELPEVWGSNQKSYTSATRGDLGKLYVLCGMLYSVCSDIQTVESVQFITANEWKGQLPKKVVEQRIQRFIPNKLKQRKLTEHEVDAIGLGLYVLGVAFK